MSKTTAKKAVAKTSAPVDAPVAEKTTEQEQRNVLLGSISYTNDADYENFLSKLDINQSMFVLIASANYAQSKGLYNLDESELVAKAIKTIKRNSVPAPEVPVDSEETTKS